MHQDLLDGEFSKDFHRVLDCFIIIAFPEGPLYGPDGRVDEFEKGSLYLAVLAVGGQDQIISVRDLIRIQVLSDTNIPKSPSGALTSF